MGAPPGNQFWKLRSKHGRDKLFKDPQLLWAAACEYFQWCDDNPLEEEKVFHTNGVITKTSVTKLRAYLLPGLLLHIHASDSYLRAFRSTHKDKDDKESKDFITVIEEIDKTIYVQKFTGAASDLLNPNIIARSLGLTDKQDVTSGGERLSPINVTVDRSETAKTLKKLRDGSKTD